MASNCKDRQLRIFDPRANSVVAQCESHDGMKDSKVIWVGGENRLMTTGFGSVRMKPRNLKGLSKI